MVNVESGASFGTVFEIHTKSLIQDCEQSELRLHFQRTNVNQKLTKMVHLAIFWKHEPCSQIVLPDRRLLIGQKSGGNCQNSKTSFSVIFKQCVLGGTFWCNGSYCQLQGANKVPVQPIENKTSIISLFTIQARAQAAHASKSLSSCCSFTFLKKQVLLSHPVEGCFSSKRRSEVRVGNSHSYSLRLLLLYLCSFSRAKKRYLPVLISVLTPFT